MNTPTLTTQQQAPSTSAAVSQPDAARPPRRRADLPALVYRCIAGLIALTVLTGPGGAVGLLSPWTDVAGGGAHFELHRWHYTDVSAFVSLLMVGSLIASLRRPRQRALLVQAFLVSGLLLGAVVSPFAQAPAEVLVPVGAASLLVIASYPSRRALLRLPSPITRGPAALAALVATPFLVTNVWQNLSRQLAGVAEHAELGHWAGAAALGLALLVTTWAATTCAAGVTTLRAVVAATYLYLGVAAIVLPRHDGSWSTSGGIVALVVGSLLAVASRGGARAVESVR